MEHVDAASSTPISIEETATRKRAGNLTRRDFFDEVVDRLRPVLPKEWSDFRHQANSLLLKVYFDNERVHYEVWCDGERQVIEIGLHFEDGPISTAAYLAHFNDLIVELKHELGLSLELERWTISWGHLFEHWPLAGLDVSLATRVASRLSQLIRALQPLVEAAGISAERSALAAHGKSSDRRGPWRTWRH